MVSSKSGQKTYAFHPFFSGRIEYDMRILAVLLQSLWCADANFDIYLDPAPCFDVAYLVFDRHSSMSFPKTLDESCYLPRYRRLRCRIFIEPENLEMISCL